MARKTFRKEDRLLRSKDFKRVFAKGRARRSPELTVYIHTPGCGRPRLGLAVGKRFAREAVKRNRCKRLMREAFRLNREALPDADIVVVPRPGAELATLDAAARALLYAIREGKPYAPRRRR